MKFLSSIMMFVMVMGVCATFAACDSGGGKEYEAIVSWEIGRVPTCSSTGLMDHGGAALQFDRMVVKVYKNEKDAKDPAASTVIDPMTAVCSQLSYTIQDLKRGTYWVVVEAWSNFEGEELPYYQGGDELVVPSEETLAIQLGLAKGTVEVGWGFDRGVCAGNGVTNVIVSMQKGTATPTTSGKILCDSGVYRFAELDWGLYSLTVDGLNTAGATTHQGIFSATPGVEQETEIETDTQLSDGGVVTDTEVETGTDTSADPNLLDVRPGKKIGTDVAYVVLKPIAL